MQLFSSRNFQGMHPKNIVSSPCVLGPGVGYFGISGKWGGGVVGVVVGKMEK
jgi:hypothetical protein